MATTAGALKAEVSISRRILLWAVALFGIFTITGVLLVFNYWAAIIFFFVSLLVLVRFGLAEYQAQGLWLLLILSLFITVLVSSLTLLVLSNDPRIPQLAQSNSIANFFLGSNLRVIITSIIIGLIAPLGLIVPFIATVAVAAWGILKWHKKNDDISAFQTFWYLLTTLLGFFYFSLTIDNLEIKGKGKDKQRLEDFGGPGWLTVYPGQVVVLHHWGKITRVIGLGLTVLARGEQIKAIVPLRGKGGSHIVENVLTLDRIPLNITVTHAVQMEPDAETMTRLQQALSDAQKNLQDLQVAANPSQQDIEAAQQKVREAQQRLNDLNNDVIIGDEYNKCYGSIARLVATKAPNIFEALKGPVANNLRDAVMSEQFDRLFELEQISPNLANRIDERKIDKIEKLVREKAKNAKISDGVVLRNVDITQVRFPEAIEDKIKTEAAALAEARIKETEARVMRLEADARSDAKVTEARANQTAAEAIAQATLIQANAEARAETLKGRAKAQYYREITEALQQ